MAKEEPGGAIPPSVDRSPALKSFAQNLARLGHVITALETYRSSNTDRRRGLRERLTDGAFTQAELDQIKSEIGALEQETTSLATAIGVAQEWLIVTLVTCTETYLQDVLAYYAEIDPDLMGGSKQAALYEEVVSAGSIEELAAELRSKWARNWVDDGGPKRWIERFVKMGARGYPDSLVVEMEALWGLRHVIIHRAGRATADLIRRHPHLDVVPGKPLPLDVTQAATTNAVVEFVRITDAYFTNRYPNNLNSTQLETT